MKEIKVSEVAPKMIEALPKGILLNSKSDKFNSMVIGWGCYWCKLEYANCDSFCS